MAECRRDFESDFLEENNTVQSFQGNTVKGWCYEILEKVIVTAGLCMEKNEYILLNFWKIEITNVLPNFMKFNRIQTDIDLLYSSFRINFLFRNKFSLF